MKATMLSYIRGGGRSKFASAYKDLSDDKNLNTAVASAVTKALKF